MNSTAVNSAIDLLPSDAPRYLFFTGKGGVGKTSLSSASAVALADLGKKVLLVSTDPASNLDQVLETKLGYAPAPVNGVANLQAMNIDPRASAARYKERVVAPYRGVLPDAAVSEIEEQLSGACTVEIAAFDEFSKILTAPDLIGRFDHVVFDTAPTGHTLRLLHLPAAWKSYIDSSRGQSSCLGPMSGLESHRDQFASTLNAISDPKLALLFLVARADRHSLAEAARTGAELRDIGISNQRLAVNGVLETCSVDDPYASSMRGRQDAALESLPSELIELPKVEIPLSPVAPIGAVALRSLLHPAVDFVKAGKRPTPSKTLEGMLTLDELIDSIGTRSGLIMTMGKGGVGKTTIAGRIALELAMKGAWVHLATTDPAAGSDILQSPKHPGLRVSRIDPAVETERYREEIMREAGDGLDEEGKRLLEEDLRSPCTEEVAVFRAFARVVNEAADSVVVLDTAPTGHTLLLLDATQAYHREVTRHRSSVSREVEILLPRLRESSFTRILIITLPEATPVQEAADLQVDLQRAGITPYAWIINQSLSGLDVSHPVLLARRESEYAHMERVMKLSHRTAIVPWIGNPDFF